MKLSTFKLFPISLYFLLIGSSLVYGSRPEFETSLNTQDASPSEDRILQDRNRHDDQNDNKYTCPTRNRCTLRGLPNTEYTIIMEKDSIFLSILNLAIQPGTELVMVYTTTSSSRDITSELYIGPYYRPAKFPTPERGSWSVVIPQSIIQANNDGAVYLEVDNDANYQVIITVKMTFGAPPSPSSESPSLLIIIMPILGGVLAIVLIVVWCHCHKKLSQAQEAREERRRRQIILAGLRAGQARSRAHEEEKEEDPLTDANMNERFPEARFETFKTSFTQTTCSVCLEEFQKDLSYRQLYCEHIFHAECIRLWLTNQLKKGIASCPNCNKSMLKKKDPHPDNIEDEPPAQAPTA